MNDSPPPSIEQLRYFIECIRDRHKPVPYVGNENTNWNTVEDAELALALIDSIILMHPELVEPL